jgi:hypothetical protein
MTGLDFNLLKSTMNIQRNCVDPVEEMDEMFINVLQELDIQQAALLGFVNAQNQGLLRYYKN